MMRGIRKRVLSLCAGAALSLGLLWTQILPASAAVELRAGETYPCAAEDFSEDESLRGIFVTGLTGEKGIRLLLGDRVVRPGDAITARDLSGLRLEAGEHAAGEAELCFLPILEEGLGEAASLTMHVLPSETEPPAALDLSLETYRNIPVSGELKAQGGEAESLSFRLAEPPRRGDVELAANGAFTYTPRKNKVGEDSFTFTVTDGAGNESQPGLVRIRIRKPSDAQTFADLPLGEQFAPLWLRETGLFGGELVNRRLSFGPDKTVTRGEFLAMLMALKGIDPEIGLQSSGFADEAEAAQWLRPYLASAMRRGIARGCRTASGLLFQPNRPITRQEAALLTARIQGREEALPAAALDGPEDLPDQTAGNRPLTRREAAALLYEISRQG